MIGQVIGHALGLPMMNQDVSRKSLHIEKVISEENSESHNQPFAQTSHHEKVRISEEAKRLNGDSGEEHSDWERIQKLTGQLSTSMHSLFMKAGIDTSEPIRININPFTGVPFVGEHPDRARIQSLLKGAPDLLEQIKQVNTVASFNYQSTLDSSIPSGTQDSVNQMSGAASGKVQNAIHQYEQNKQTPVVALEYQQDVGITLNVLNNARGRV